MGCHHGFHEHGCSQEHHHHGHFGKECGHQESGHHDEKEKDAWESEELFCLAKTAWKAVLVDKLKAEIEKCQGEELTQLAKLITETKVEKVKAKLTICKKKEEFKERVWQLISAGVNK